MLLAELLLLLTATLTAQPDRFGLPACNAPDQELADRAYFLLCHSGSLKVPIWVGYELKPQHLARVAITHRHHFRPDRLLAHAGAQDSDYKFSGYSRGHIAPAADFAWSEDALRATFILSNSAPQLQTVNAGPWARLERAVRRSAETADAVYVFSGPIFDREPSVIGAGCIAVPTHFFKAIFVEQGGQRTMYAAIVPNTPTSEPLTAFFTSVDDIEKRTGLNLFSTLEDEEEERLESQSLPWPFTRP